MSTTIYKSIPSGEIIDTIVIECDDGIFGNRSIWAHEDNTYTISDDDGDHEPIAGCEIEDYKKHNDATKKYVKTVARTGVDSICRYFVAKSRELKIQLLIRCREWTKQNAIGLWVDQIIVKKGKYAGKYYPHNCQKDIARFLCLKHINDTVFPYDLWVMKDINLRDLALNKKVKIIKKNGDPLISVDASITISKNEREIKRNIKKLAKKELLTSLQKEV